jgi:uncharacterized protein involved in exopolysaccharide biosynthesis
VIVSLIVYRQTPPIYQARATVVDERESSGYDGNRKTVFDTPRTGLERLLRSDFVVPVARRIAGLPPGSSVDGEMMSRVRDTIRYEVVGNLLYFKGRGGDPELVSKVANEYAQQFVNSSQSRKVNKTGQAADFYEKQLSEKKAELDRAEAALQAFANSHRGTLPDDVGLHAQALQQLRDQSSQTEADLQARREERESFVASLSQLPAPGSGADANGTLDANDPVLRLQRLEAELADLSGRFTEKHPDVQQKERDIAALKAQIAAIPPRAKPENTTASKADAQFPLGPARIGVANFQRVQSMDREISRLQSRAESLRGQIARHDGAIAGAGHVSVEWAALNRARTNLLAEYNTLLGNSQKADLTQDMTTTTTLQNDYRILELSEPPGKPVGPLLVVLLPIGLGIGLGVGGALAFLGELMDQTYKTADDITNDLGVPVVATISRIDAVRGQEDRERKRRRAS